MQAWETLSRRVILDYSKFLVVEEHAVQLPDGHVIPDWPWVVTPDFVNVVAITEEGQHLCFRQTKYGIDGTSLAPVGGFMEPGEAPLAAAQRELLEETGYEGSEWIPLGSYRVDANRGAGTAYFFLAQSVHRVTEAEPDDLEEQELLTLTRGEMEAALIDGQFKVLPWAAIVALALRIVED
jgi:8-oxo-dGTP pyrophosphatase MutT (NUDIX family)